MRKFYYLLKVSVEKAIKDVTRYKFDTFSQIIGFYALFLAMLLGLKAFGSYMDVVPAKMGGTVEGFVAGYFLWTIMVMAYSDISYGIINDAGRGTLEQLNMSELGLTNVLIIRCISNILIYLLISFVILFSIMITTGYWLHIRVFSMLICIFIGLFSILGISLIFGGLALIFKKIQSLLSIAQYAMMALVIPGYHAFSKTVTVAIPFRPTIENVYAIMFGGIGCTDFSLYDFGSMIINSILYMAVGLLIFDKCCKTAKKKGLLGQY